MIEIGNILVTGASSGLGKHCVEYFKGTPFTRQTDYAAILNQAERKPYKAIIHCAFNTKSNVNSTQLYSYLSDTTLLTKKLLQIPHEKFIFISSADVYPKNNNLHAEDEVINLADVNELYPFSKLTSESIIQNETQNYLIIRPTAMLGQYARPNSLMKILTHDTPTITLSSESEFNYIRHADISQLIEVAAKQNLTGIYNASSATNITLAEVVRHFNRTANFGNYVYRVSRIANTKVAAIVNSFNNTSLENIKLHLQASEALIETGR